MEPCVGVTLSCGTQSISSSSSESEVTSTGTERGTRMDVVLLLLMAAPGLCAGRQYHFITEGKSFPEAQRYCREKHTDLATVDSMEDVETLNQKAPGGIVAFIGLYDDVNGWRWSLSDTSFYQHGEAEFRRWQDGEPNNRLGKERCTVMNEGGLWQDHICESKFPPVCSDVRGLNVTFVLINASMTWTEAQSYCREHHTDLASVRDETENQKVRELIPAGSVVWIGFFRDSWKWSDGSSSSFRFWEIGEPNNNGGNRACAVAHFGYSGKWADVNCSPMYAFICYDAVSSKQVIRVRLQRKSSSLDLNDPAVMERMLQQLKQKLKDQGVKGDVKLSWRKQADGKVFHKEEKKKTGKRKDEL